MEICDFYKYVESGKEESAVRLDIINRVSKSVAAFYAPQNRNTEVHAFGSFAVGLYLPVADMDLVALSSSFLRSGRPGVGKNQYDIRALGAKLVRDGHVRTGTLQPIPYARVPLLKFVDDLTGVKVDLSFENTSGLAAISTIEAWKEEFPAMPKIVALIKQLLAMYGQNEVSTGGLGGYTIICLVVSMMQHMPEIQSGSMEGELHYGDLLMNFLELYGNRFDYEQTGIIMNPPEYYNKREHTLVREKASRLTVIDPNNSQNDISGGSSNISQIFAIFSMAHARIQQRLADLHNMPRAGSILGCCWKGNYTSFEVQRDQLRSGYGAVLAAGGPVFMLPIPNITGLQAVSRSSKPSKPMKRKRFDDQEQYGRHKFARRH